MEERANCDFDQEDLARGILGDTQYELMKEFQEDMVKHPEICNTPAYYEMTPAEKQTWWFKKLNYIWFKMPEKRDYYFATNPMRGRFAWHILHFGQSVGTYHQFMVYTAMRVCSSDEQQKKWLPMFENYDILSSYA